VQMNQGMVVVDVDVDDDDDDDNYICDMCNK
jgi:hypothetical protein